LICKVSASKPIKKCQKQVSNLSLSSETNVTVNLTTLEQLWRVQKSRMDPRKGLGTERRLGWAACSANLEKMGNLDLQKGELPKLLCIVFYLEKMGVPG